MRSVTVRTADLENIIINLGFVGENEHRQIRFDAKKDFEEYPNASASLTVAPPEGEKYPAIIERDGDFVIWTITDSDVIGEGAGEIQLAFTENEVIKKTHIGRTKTDRSLVPTGDIPSGIDDFITRAGALLEEVEETFPAGGTTGQVLAKKSDADYDTEWVPQSGGGGTGNYDELVNRPKINGVTLTGNKSLHDLGAAAESDIPDVSGFYTKPETGIPASDIADGVIPDVTDLEEDVSSLKSAITRMDTATASAIGKALSPKTVTNGKVTEWQFAPIEGGGGSVDLFYVTPEEFGAVGDGETDDSQAVQDACDAGYAVYFGSKKTYYIPTPITIDHDIHLFGGEDTILKTKTLNGSLNDILVCQGTLKKSTTLTTDYTSNGDTDNSGNKFTLDDMDGINTGDIMVIKATDQYYSYVRQYYYLGMSMLIGDKDDNHLYATESIPYDITLTQNVSVSIYSAPTVIIESLNFVGDRESIGRYKHFIVFNACKNSIIRNCKFSEMDDGIQIDHCVNTLIDNIFMSEGKNDNTIRGDGYGIEVDASTNTTIQRVNSIIAQTPITTGGDVTTVNLYVRNCDLTAQCRHHGIGMHENSFNIVVEDCTLGGANILGTGIINRCRFIKNNRINADGGITFCGNHNPKHAILKVSNCTFETGNKIYIYAPSPQDPIQATDNIIGLVEVTDCDGGYIVFEGTVSQDILSNVIKEMRLTRWTNCKEFYRPNASTDIIEKMTVSDCSFIERFWVNDHADAHEIVLTNIHDLDYRSSIPMQHKISVDKDVYAEKYTLPENTPIQLSSGNSSAEYIVCGKNLASNDPNDYEIGTVSGSDGGTLTRTKATANVPTITADENGNIVYTQLNNTSSYSIYPAGMFYIKEPVQITLSAKLKNTGETSGATFRPYIAVVDCDTGKLISRYASTAVEATAIGADISCQCVSKANCIAMGYFYCNSPVALAETTFEDMSVMIRDYFAPYSKESIPPYIARKRTGDGTILSLDGVNNIMCADLDFHVKIMADYIENPIGILPGATGVSF